MVINKLALFSASILMFGFLVGCSKDQKINSPSTGTEATTESRVTTHLQQETHVDMTDPSLDTKSWSSENKEVKLTPVKEGQYSYESVAVDVNGVNKAFDWSFSTTEDPRIYYTDVTGDGKEEAVIILNKGKGTGLNIDELHVLDGTDLSEIKVQSYQEIVAGQIETGVTRKNDQTLAIKVKSQGKEHQFDYHVAGINFKQDKLSFGGVIYYWMKNQQIVTTLGASVGISPQYVGDFQITYKFDQAENKLIADQIRFEPVHR
ncbi:hypothetical protein [Paenibacillus favisporus]|uniref:hypothetical protein n=1 Tax=Paenibacillus favisporus TaxID=221028 RepID=UPI003D2A1F95